MSDAATLVVSNSPELYTALTAAAPGDTVLARAGVYLITQPLVVKDGVTVRGESLMRFAADGLPAGLDPSGETVLQAAPSLVGDFVTLGDGTTLSGLAMWDVPGRVGGNIVTIASRVPADVVSATIYECEIFNPEMPGVGPQGPIGRSVVVITRNPNLAAPPLPHYGSMMALSMTRSVVRTTQSNPSFNSGCWAHNFASGSIIALTLTQNVLGGGIELIGGNSRPDSTTGSSVQVTSRGNLYRSDTPATPQPIGVLALGATSPTIPGIIAGSAANNRVDVLSVQDRIEGFQTAIYAVATRRPTLVAGAMSGNHVELSVHGARLVSTLRDLVLLGSESFVGPLVVDTDNSVRLQLSNSTGSGVRANVYSHGLANGAGNRLEIVGSSTSFAHTNQQIFPAPTAEFFSSSQ